MSDASILAKRGKMYVRSRHALDASVRMYQDAAKMQKEGHMCACMHKWHACNR
jgi:hypothetical protein